MPSLFNQNVSLTPKLQRFIAEKVSSGRYRSASEVVREALRYLERSDMSRRDHDLLRVDGSEAETALRESEERLRSLAANMPSAMVYQIILSGKDGERRFSFVAESCERLNGVKADQVIQNPLLLYEMLLPEHREAFSLVSDRSHRHRRDGVLKRLVTFDDAVDHGEQRHVGRQGSQRRCEFSLFLRREECLGPAVIDDVLRFTESQPAGDGREAQPGALSRPADAEVPRVVLHQQRDGVALLDTCGSHEMGDAVRIILHLTVRDRLAGAGHDVRGLVGSGCGMDS